MVKGEFIVRNSPIEYLTSFVKGVVIAGKAAGKATLGTGFGFALAHELDDILEKEGKAAH